MHVRFAPIPPEYTLQLSLDGLTRKDARFAHLPSLRARGVLHLVVQDSAELQHAHLIVGSGEVRWIGTPGATSPLSTYFDGWREHAVEYFLGLDLAVLPPRRFRGGHQHELTSGACGVVYVLQDARVKRRLDLTNLADRFELEWWLEATDVSFRRHRLCEDGRLEVVDFPVLTA